jgi:aspartate aminotransferase
MKFTDRINRINESLTIGMAKKARELRAAGKDIISLSLGEPDFDTPEHIKQAAIKALQEGKTKYPPVGGIPELKDAIISKYKRQHNLEFNANQIVVSTGAKQCIMNVIMSLVQKGDEVIIPLPYWVSYSEMVSFAGGKSVYVPSVFEKNFALDMNALKDAINKNTKCIIFSSPSNPAGSIIPLEQMEELAEILKQNPQITLISDEIYEHINFEGNHQTMAQFTEVSEQIVVINGVSKGFSMTGWRIGYMLANEKIATACDKLQGQFTSGANTIAQWASVAAINDDLKPTEEMTSAFKKRRDLVMNLMEDIPSFECSPPPAAFYLFPRVSSLYGKKINGVEIKDSISFCEYLLEYAQVAIVPGIAFGMDDHVRISYASSVETLGEAFSRIKKALP